MSRNVFKKDELGGKNAQMAVPATLILDAKIIWIL